MPSISGPRSTVASNVTVTPFVSGATCSLLIVLSSIEDVARPSYSSVEKHFDPSCDCIRYAWECVECRHRVVELATTMIEYHQRSCPVLDTSNGVIGMQDPLRDDRERRE